MALVSSSSSADISNTSLSRKHNSQTHTELRELSNQRLQQDNLWNAQHAVWGWHKERADV